MSSFESFPSLPSIESLQNAESWQYTNLISPLTPWGGQNLEDDNLIISEPVAFAVTTSTWDAANINSTSLSFLESVPDPQEDDNITDPQESNNITNSQNSNDSNLVDDPQLPRNYAADPELEGEDNELDADATWLPENVYEYPEFTTGTKLPPIQYKKPRVIYPEDVVNTAVDLLESGTARSENALAPNTFKNYKNMICDFLTAPMYNPENVNARTLVKYILYKRKNGNIAIKYEQLLKKVISKYVLQQAPPRMPRRPVGSAGRPPNRYSQVFVSQALIGAALQNLYDQCVNKSKELKHRVIFTNLFVCTAFTAGLGCRSVDIQRLPLDVLKNLITTPNYKFMLQTQKGYKIPHQIMTYTAFMVNAQNPEFKIEVEDGETVVKEPIGNIIQKMLMRLVDWAKTPYLIDEWSYLPVVNDHTPILSWPPIRNSVRSNEITNVMKFTILSFSNRDKHIILLKTGVSGNAMRALNGCLGQHLFRRYRISQTYMMSREYTSDINTRRLVAQTLAGHTNLKQTNQYLRLADASDILRRISMQQEPSGSS